MAGGKKNYAEKERRSEPTYIIVFVFFSELHYVFPFPTVQEMDIN